MEVNEMVERVARAIRPGAYDHRSAQFPPDELEQMREEARDAARRALSAMREPTGAVVRAMNLALAREHTTNVNVSATMQAWSDGIDAALSSGEQDG